MTPKVKDMLKKWGVAISSAVFIADPSGQSKPREGTGSSSFDLYKAEGLYMLPANNRILEGIQTINSLFYLDKLQINDTCSGLIDALLQAVFPTDENGDVKKEEYKVIHPYIDMLDALRYGCMCLAPRLEAPVNPQIFNGLGY